jgi:hypothetical protein
MDDDGIADFSVFIDGVFLLDCNGEWVLLGLTVIYDAFFFHSLGLKTCSRQSSSNSESASLAFEISSEFAVFNVLIEAMRKSIRSRSFFLNLWLVSHFFLKGVFYFDAFF